MRENAVRRIWQEGGTAVTGWLTIPSPLSAEILAHQGWDALTIDMQHGLIGYSEAAAMMQAISATPVTPLVRVPWLDPGTIMKMLDAGAYGIICPMINSRADAERLVAACRYPPRGNRSYGPVRAMLYAGSDYAAHANDTVIAFAMIETREGLDALDEILSVEGLDAVYIGPADLGLALGYPPAADREEPEVVEAIRHIVAACRSRGVVAGIHNASAAYARRMIDLGCRFVNAGSDARMLAERSRQILAELRGAGGTPDRPAGPY